MKLTDFMGGQDVQRSLNMSDNRLINLYPTANDKGDITAFVTTPGLVSYTTTSGIVLGMYTASNGRCFLQTGTTLWEMTTGGTLTSRGTVTASTTTKFNDNGIDLILVNGTDGWLFKFATNALKKITVKQATFTVTIASPAVLTSTTHGLVAGDVLRLSATGVYGASEFAATCTTPNGITISQDGTSVYAVSFSGGNTVSMYSRNTSTGTITPLGTPTIATGVSPFEIAITSDGAHVYVTNIGAATVSQYSRSLTTGALTALGTPTIATGTGPNGIVISPSCTHVYVVNQGSDTVSQYSITLATGQLVALGTPTIATGSGPTRIAISDDGASVYVVNATGNTVSQYSRSSITGQLTAISTPIATGIAPTGITISPDGSTVYVADTAIYQYSRSTATGILTLLSTVATSGSVQDIVATNTAAYCSDNSEGTVSMYSRSPSTGLLTASGSISTVLSPYRIVLDTTESTLYISCFASSSIYKFDIANATYSGLPIGLTTLTDYYVVAPVTANDFGLSTSLGGSAINTTGFQNGLFTYTSRGYGFPNGCKTVSYMNGRFAACLPNTQEFYVSDVLDAYVWDALNVQTVDSTPDYVITEATLRNELVVFGETTGEVYYDSGTVPTPFVRMASGIFNIGCAAVYSVVKLDNTIFWLGKNLIGTGMIYKLNGYTPQRISTYSIEYAMQGMSTVADAQAFSYQQDGHHFYVITFPTGGKTYCFDLNTNLWHERAAFSAGVFSQWEALHYTNFDGKHLVSDNVASTIYSLSLSTYTDGENVHKWVRSFRAPSSEMKRSIHHKLTLEAEMGVGIQGGATPTVMLKYSNDGGHTWSADNWRDLGIGAIGEYFKRVFWHRLGMTTGQVRLYEISGTSACKTVLIAVYLS